MDLKIKNFKKGSAFPIWDKKNHYDIFPCCALCKPIPSIQLGNCARIVYSNKSG